jgi:chromosome partitioning protein
MIVSDTILIPTAPRSFDLWGVDQTSEILWQAREINPNLRAVAVLNGADAQGSDNTASLAALAELTGITVSDCLIGRRKAYPNAAAAGLGVLEYSEPSNPAGVARARLEIARLSLQLFGFIAQALPAIPERISA